MKTSQYELVGIQILRGLAACLVIWHHSLEEAQFVAYEHAPPDWLIRFGAAGVDIFFVISGFIMMYVNFAPGRQCAAPVEFLLKRALRIYPFYWVCCALALLLKAVGFYRNMPLAPSVILNSLFLFPFERTLIIGVAWTLVYELYFYVVFAMSLPRRSPLASLLGTTAMIALCYAFGRQLPFPDLRSFLACETPFEFCFGLGIGYLATRYELRRVATWASLLGYICLVVLSSGIEAPSTSGRDDDVQRLWFWGVPSALIVLGAVYWQPRAGTASRVARTLGDASYAMYLSHGFVMTGYAVALRKVPALNHVSQWPVTFAICLVALIVGVIAHWTVERSANRLAHHALRRTPRVQSNGSPQAALSGAAGRGEQFR